MEAFSNSIDLAEEELEAMTDSGRSPQQREKEKKEKKKRKGKIQRFLISSKSANH